jgi:hypothetical protein
MSPAHARLKIRLVAWNIAMAPGKWSSVKRVEKATVYRRRF